MLQAQQDSGVFSFIVVVVLLLLLLLLVIITQVFTEVDIAAEHLPNPPECPLGTAVQQTKVTMTNKRHICRNG